MTRRYGTLVRSDLGSRRGCGRLQGGTDGKPGLMTLRTGHCLCERVRYEFDSEPTDASFCHCSICRRLSGSAFASWCEVPRKSVRWSGRDNLLSYRITDRLDTFFCRSCGTALLAEHSNWPDCAYLPMGTLDDASAIAPQYHQFTASKASWYKIHDPMPQYKQWPEGAGG